MVKKNKIDIYSNRKPSILRANSLEFEDHI